ncbi:MAG: hypothetical protein JSR31_01875 [Nitrospira sp.]|nr:hypothetical protein [Nitrospira sp.]
MAYAITVESAIRAELINHGPCMFEALVQRLSPFSWNEVFAAVDQLSRDGRLVLRHTTRFDYEVSIGLTQPDLELIRARWAAEGDMLCGHRDSDSQASEEQIYS